MALVVSPVVDATIPGLALPVARIAAPVPPPPALDASTPNRSAWAVLKTAPWPLALSPLTADPVPFWVIQKAPPELVVLSRVAAEPA